MAPKSTIGIKNPPKGFYSKSPEEWLNEKRAVDDAEGLWRVHDGLYDLTSFIQIHPGGQFWIQETQGMDVTEAFECHHISTIPNDLLGHYYVRAATTPRLSPFTFDENGFYKILKTRVRKIVKTIPKQTGVITDRYTDMLLVLTFALGIAANAFWNFFFCILSGVFLAATSVASHNYSHRRDNIRMYYGDIFTQSLRNIRIVHVLSHHLFTNTTADMQVYLSEPFMVLFPQRKTFLTKYFSWFFVPVLFWPVIFNLNSVVTLFKLVRFWWVRLDVTDVLSCLFPMTMYILGEQSIFATILMWQLILAVGSLSYNVCAYTSGHFHPKLFMDGDATRPGTKVDWGVHQLDCVVDRREVTGNKLLVLTSFGEHALHHLFPTLDHSVLEYLYPVVQETLDEFKLNIHVSSTPDMFFGFFKQIVREDPNQIPPNNIKFS